MAREPAVPKTKNQRVTVGHVGQSPLYVINEYLVVRVAGWENFMERVAIGKYKGFAEEMSKFIAPGSQHGVILRIVA